MDVIENIEKSTYDMEDDGKDILYSDGNPHHKKKFINSQNWFRRRLVDNIFHRLLFMRSYEKWLLIVVVMITMNMITQFWSSNLKLTIAWSSTSFRGSREVVRHWVPRSIDGFHLLLGKPWYFDRSAVHDWDKNTYSLSIKGKNVILSPCKDGVFFFNSSRGWKEKNLLSMDKIWEEVQTKGMVYCLVLWENNKVDPELLLEV